MKLVSLTVYGPLLAIVRTKTKSFKRLNFSMSEKGFVSHSEKVPMAGKKFDF